MHLFTRSDLSNEVQCSVLVAGMDVVYHLAAETDMAKSTMDPAGAMWDDLQSTVNILRACAERERPPRVVIASSAAVYGDTFHQPLKEEDAEGARPRSPYAIHKRACEMYAEVYSVLNNLSVACLRYFNVYGPGQVNTKALIPAFILAAIRDGTVHVNGTGEHTRDFVYVSDVVDATIMMGSVREIGVWNVGTGHSRSIMDVARVLRKTMRINIKITRDPARKYDILHSRANIDKIGQLGWTPKVSFEEGLEKTVFSAKEVS